MIGVIKEVPSVRFIDFMGAIVTFVPHDGTYWVSPTDIKAATGVDIGQAGRIRLYYPDKVDTPTRDTVIQSGSKFKIDTCFSLRSAEWALRTCNVPNDQRFMRVSAFVALISLLPACVVSNVSIPAVDNKRLRAIIDHNAHWIPVMRLWNAGLTEKEISEELSISIVKVRSAVAQLREHGLDVMPKRLRKEIRVDAPPDLCVGGPDKSVT